MIVKSKQKKIRDDMIGCKNKWSLSDREHASHGRRKKGRSLPAIICLAFAALLLMPLPAYATSGYAGNISQILESMIDVIGTIFIAVGILLGAYAIGSLVLAFKNEDADSKSRATTLTVVAVVLISIKPIIEALDLLSFLN